jgi:hypothetical protein
VPELAAGFLVGAVFALATGLIFTLTQLSKYRSSQYLLIQKNLELIGLRWNDLEGCVGPIKEEFTSEQQTFYEVNKARTTYYLFTTAAVLLSWLGFVFLLLMWVSIKKLVRNRNEENLFASPLAFQALDAGRVKEIWQALPQQ